MTDEPPFDVDAFLQQPLVARLATSGPTVRPVWYLWEAGTFWWLTGDWSIVRDRLADDPRVALVVDTCDLATGRVRQVIATGHACIRPYDRERALRKLQRYLGNDVSTWDRRFDPDDRSANVVFVRLVPSRLIARDLSYRIATEPARRTAARGGDPRAVDR